MGFRGPDTLYTLKIESCVDACDGGGELVVVT